MHKISLTKLIVIAAISIVTRVNAACDYSVIVIGAGASGMGAAKELKTQGCNVTVLEARNRTGGRINTENMGANKVDMGASWIHGIGPGLGEDPKYQGKFNPIYTIAQDSKIATYQTWAD
jgi:monoamine oxidase